MLEERALRIVGATAVQLLARTHHQALHQHAPLRCGLLDEGAIDRLVGHGGSLPSSKPRGKPEKGLLTPAYFKALKRTRCGVAASSPRRLRLSASYSWKLPSKKTHW